MAYAGHLVVDGPPPTQPCYGLLSVARIIPEPNERWANGVSPWVYPRDLPGTHDPCATGSQITNKAVGSALADPTALDFGSFTIYSPETCTAYRIGDVDEYRRRATVQMAASEQWALEQEFEQGLRVPSNPFLAKAGATTAQAVPGTAVIPRVGLAYLERAIANTAVAGVIHATVEIATVWAKDFLIEDENGVMYTCAKHTPVVVGSGYLGVAPAGTAAITGTVQCAYATGPIDVRRSEMFVVPDELSQALDRSSNTVVYRAERNYVYDWDAARLRAYARIDWAT